MAWTTQDMSDQLDALRLRVSFLETHLRTSPPPSPKKRVLVVEVDLPPDLDHYLPPLKRVEVQVFPWNNPEPIAGLVSTRFHVEERSL